MSHGLIWLVTVGLLSFPDFNLNRGLYWIIYLVGLLSWPLCHPWIAGKAMDTWSILMVLT